MAEYKLFLYLEKCELEQDRVSWVGHLRKQSWDRSSQGFWSQWVACFKVLGFVNFYYYFIWDFSAITHLLFNLTGSSSTWIWKNKQQESFNTLKKAVIFTPVLVSLDNTKPFYIEANSSDFTTGTFLSQQLEVDGKWYLVAFFNKFLFLVEQNYEIHNKKILAIIYVLEK